MELQVATLEHVLVTFIKVKKGGDNPFLQSLGFGSGNIKNLDLGRDVSIGGVTMGHHLYSPHTTFLKYSG